MSETEAALPDAVTGEPVAPVVEEAPVDFADVSDNVTVAGEPIESTEHAPKEAKSSPEAVQDTSDTTKPQQESAPPSPPETRPDPISVFGEVSVPSGGILGISGITYESCKTAQLLLNENHLRYHWAFNDRGFHNHLSHHILAAFSLGAPASTLQSIYELHAYYQRPLPPLHTTISDANLSERFGDVDAYSDYLAFFTTRVTTHGPVATIERYLFTTAGHDLFIRTLSGAFHPLIQIGHGIEFNLPALVAEGLAWAACHSALVAPLFEADFIPPPRRTGSISMAGLAIASRLHLTNRAPLSFAATARRLKRESREPAKGLAGFSILQHILNDPELEPGKVVTFDEPNKTEATVKKGGWRIRMWADEWVVDEDGGFEEIVAKVEELIWMATVIYAASSRPGLPTKLDFFLMHGLTSVLFLPSLVEVLSPTNSIKLLQGYFRVLLTTWVARGRPALHITHTLMAATNQPRAPTAPSYSPGAVEKALRTEAKGKQKETDPSTPRPPSLPNPSSDAASSANPWSAIVASASDYPEEHVTKVIRSLCFAASLFGHSPPGIFKGPLQGTDIMDGTIFVRAAGLTLDTLGWAREDQVLAGWGRDAPGFDEAWTEKS